VRLAHDALQIARIAESQIEVLHCSVEGAIRCGLANQLLEHLFTALLLPDLVFDEAM